MSYFMFHGRAGAHLFAVPITSDALLLSRPAVRLPITPQAGKAKIMATMAGK